MLLPRLRLQRVGASLAARATCTVASTRNIHHVPRLRYDYAETGVPNLMSAPGFNIAWTEYMTMATEKLNALTAGTAPPCVVSPVRGARYPGME